MSAAMTNVYTSVHNLHTLCYIPVCTAEPVYWTQAKWDNPHEPCRPMTEGMIESPNVAIAQPKGCAIRKWSWGLRTKESYKM